MSSFSLYSSVIRVTTGHIKTKQILKLNERTFFYWWAYTNCLPKLHKNIIVFWFPVRSCPTILAIDWFRQLLLKNTAYGRHWISQRVRIVTNTTKWRQNSCVSCHQNQQPQPQTLPLLTLPLCKLGQFWSPTEGADI